MAEYIDRVVLIETLKNWRDAHADVGDAEGYELIEDVMQEIIEQASADVMPVVRAEWVNPHWMNSDYCYDCSNCGGEAMHRVYRWRDEKIYPICPYCGAKMDGGANNG